MKSSRCNKPSCRTRSALLRNLNAKPISSRPNTTFTLFNHPPLCGKLFNHPGKAENNPKGSARAEENPSITAVGAAKDPVAAPAKADPTRGPVHEKDTIASVAAMKKMPMMPPRSDAASALLAQLEGSWISNAPKKLAPKMSNSKNRNTLKMGSVEITFKTSTPKKAVKANPSAV